MSAETIDEERLGTEPLVEQGGRAYVDALKARVEHDSSSAVELDDASMRTFGEITNAAFADLNVEGGLVAVAAGNASIRNTVNEQGQQ